VQQRLASAPKIPHPPVPPIMPPFIPPPQVLEKSYSTEPTPVIVSSAPKLYAARPTVGVQPKVEAPAAPAPVQQSVCILGRYYKSRIIARYSSISV
jgi:hypothetical protein